MKSILWLLKHISRTKEQNALQCSAEAAFLRHCRTNFENDTAKTVPVGHLALIDFRPVAGL